MEENILEQVPDFKLHKKQTITICTFLAGPLVGGYLLAENFNQLNERRKAIMTWIYTIAGTIILLCSIIFIPALEKIPGFLFAVFYTLLASFFVKRFQESRINLHQQKGGQFFPVGRAILASFISVVVMLALILLILLIASPDLFEEL